MKVSIPTADFVTAVDVATKVAPFKALISSMFLRLSCTEAGLLTGSVQGIGASEVHAQGTVDDPGKDWFFFADRRMVTTFSSICHKSRAKAVELVYDLKAGSLLLKCGRHKLLLETPPDIGSATDWTKPGKQLKLSKVLRGALTVGGTFAPLSAAADNMRCTYLIKGKGVLSSDSFVIFAVDDASVPVTTPLPLEALALLADKDTFLWADKQMTAVQYPCGWIYQGINTRCWEAYPMKDLRNVVFQSLKQPVTFTLDAVKALQEHMAYLGSFTYSQEDGAVALCKPIEGKNQINMTVTSVQGKFSTQAHTKEPLPKLDDMRWNLVRLKKWVDYIVENGATEIEVRLHKHCYTFSAQLSKTVKAHLVHAEITK